MPKMNPMGYITGKLGGLGRRALDNRDQYAQAAKQTSMGIAKRAQTGMSSGAKAISKHPYKAGLGGVVGLGAASYMTGGSRRGRGVDRVGRGRPTGMYKY